MTNLYTYRIPTDDGAAPNPYHGFCTLAICKGQIRNKAQVGDWVVGIGCQTAKDRMVYAMRINLKMTFQEYDQWAQVNCPRKVPNMAGGYQDRCGDCIYAYNDNGVTQRRGPHTQEHQETDLRGKYVLVSSRFWYYGQEAVGLPSNLQIIVPKQQESRVHVNQPHLESFVTWIRTLPLGVHGHPQHRNL